MVLLVISFALFSAISAVSSITYPHRIQRLIAETTSGDVDAVLNNLTGFDKFYLTISMAPIVLTFLLFLSPLPRSSAYGMILIVLFLCSMLFRPNFAKQRLLIISESTLELIIYCDLIYNGVGTFM